jgi:MFS family permease
MNGLQTLPQWKEYFNNPTGSLLGLVNAAQSIGSVIILPLVGLLSDRFGRKKVLLSGIITIIIATAIGAGSVDLGMLVFSRVCVGAGGMLIVQPAPLLIAELAYPTHRGKYTSAFWTMYYLGRCCVPRYFRSATNSFKVLSSHLGSPSVLRTMLALGAGGFLHSYKLAGLLSNSADSTGFQSHRDGWWRKIVQKKPELS